MHVDIPTPVRLFPVRYHVSVVRYASVNIIPTTTSQFLTVMNAFLCNNETLFCGPIPFVSIEAARITETRNNVVHYVKMQFLFLVMGLDFFVFMATGC